MKKLWLKFIKVVHFFFHCNVIISLWKEKDVALHLKNKNPLYPWILYTGLVEIREAVFRNAFRGQTIILDLKRITNINTII